MSTQRDELANDSLGRTIRETLQMYVGDQLPSERVWQRIRAGLDGDANTNTPGSSLRQRPFWIAPLLQVTAVLMLCLVQGVGLHTPAVVEPAVVPQEDMPVAVVTPRNTSEETTSVPTQRRVVDLNLRLLKEHSAPSVPAVPAVAMHEPLLTANLGALVIEGAGARRGIAGKQLPAWAVLESRIRR